MPALAPVFLRLLSCPCAFLQEVAHQLMTQFQCYPVFLGTELKENYYKSGWEHCAALGLRYTCKPPFHTVQADSILLFSMPLSCCCRVLQAAAVADDALSPAPQSAQPSTL
jgi:hypothetical protein